MKKKLMNQPTITLEEITPAKAAEYLKGNACNRRMSYNHLNRFTAEMQADEWHITGDTIKMNGDRLLDGQHRLEAVVRSGKTVQMFVARDVDSDVFPFLDTGKTRVGGDVLAASGYGNVYLTASVARLIWFFERKEAFFHATITNNAVLLTVKRHPALSQFVTDVQAHKFAKTSGVVASLYWIWCCDTQKGDQFIDQFLSGLELKVTSPIYALREKVINEHKLRSGRTSRRALVAMFFRAWDAWLSGRAQTRAVILNTSPTGFPWPENGPYL